MSRRDDLDAPLRFPTEETRQTIGAFARVVGLSASALRQYGDSGLLVPARIEERTGYRYYSPDQQQRAIWIRRLRDAGLGLSRVRTILDGDVDEAEALLDEWLSDAEERRSSAAELVADLKQSLRARAEANPVHRTTARFDGAVLADAIEQVSEASAAGEPGFGGVLLELGPGAAAVVATDRHLLMARLAVASDVDGPRARVHVDDDDLPGWLRARGRVELVVETPTGRDGTTAMRASFRDGAGERMLTCLPDPFPSVREMLRVESDATRCVFGRTDAQRVARGVDGVVLRVRAGRAALRSDAGRAEGPAQGGPVDVTLSTALLRRIVDATVGPWLTCDVLGSRDSVSWRAPSQPDFVALMMPRA
ncbi:MerR family transcriptional regulator [Microbacterium sp. Mu-80]|uniref:MerR family transcriptional regulator n=1 Tax=Microbacterium bandirmense TaxID=3122050 RepID=A0ABU8LBL5_9MICO